MLALCGCLGNNPLHDRVTTIPPSMPPPAPQPSPTGSIFLASHNGGQMMLAEDRKARNVGDVLTILLVERMQAEKSAAQNTARATDRSLDLPDKKPFSWVSDELFSASSQSSFSGSGSAQQANRLSGEITVTIREVLPNGSFIVSGDRRMTLNRGEEQVQLTGIVRPQDISADNRILSTRVADARLRYSGTGELAQQSKQGWLSRFFDRISPF